MCRHVSLRFLLSTCWIDARALVPDESTATPASPTSANQFRNYPIYAKPMHVSPFTFKNTAFARLPQRRAEVVRGYGGLPCKVAPESGDSG